MTEAVWIPVWMAIIAGVFPLLTLIIQIWQAKVQKANAEQIKLLEKNTNSMKDALVKITGESENAIGHLKGVAEEKARAANEIASGLEYAKGYAAGLEQPVPVPKKGQEPHEGRR